MPPGASLAVRFVMRPVLSTTALSLAAAALVVAALVPACGGRTAGQESPDAGATNSGGSGGASGGGSGGSGTSSGSSSGSGDTTDSGSPGDSSPSADTGPVTDTGSSSETAPGDEKPVAVCQLAYKATLKSVTVNSPPEAASLAAVIDPVGTTATLTLPAPPLPANSAIGLDTPTQQIGISIQSPTSSGYLLGEGTGSAPGAITLDLLIYANGTLDCAAGTLVFTVWTQDPDAGYPSAVETWDLTSP